MAKDDISVRLNSSSLVKAALPAVLSILGMGAYMEVRALPSETKAARTMAEQSVTRTEFQAHMRNQDQVNDRLTHVLERLENIIINERTK